MDERSEATYLTILGAALLAIGGGIAWATHLTWLDRFDSARHATGMQVAWHGLKSVLPFVVLAAAHWVLPRRRMVVATLCLAGALVTAVGFFEWRSALRSAGRDIALSFAPLPTTWQMWAAVLGTLIAATVSRWQHPDARRP